MTQEEKDETKRIEEMLEKLKDQRRDVLAQFGKANPLIHQLVDLALLQNGMLKGADLDAFLKRSVEML